MKRLYMMIAILLSLLILLGLAVYRHKNHYGNTDIIYVDRSSAINMVCEFDDTYKTRWFRGWISIKYDAETQTFTKEYLGDWWELWARKKYVLL